MIDHRRSPTSKTNYSAPYIYEARCSEVVDTFRTAQHYGPCTADVVLPCVLQLAHTVCPVGNNSKIKTNSWIMFNPTLIQWNALKLEACLSSLA